MPTAVVWRLVHPALPSDPLLAHADVDVLMSWHGAVVFCDGALVAAAILDATVSAFLNAAAAWIMLPPDARLAFRIDAESLLRWPWEAMWGPLVIASALAHVGCPPAPELAGPWSALAPQRSRPTTPGRFLPRVRDDRLPTMQVMGRWRQKVTRTVIPAHHCIFCGGPEEDTGHMRILCARDEPVPRLLCVKVEEFLADLLLLDKAMEFMS